MVKNKKTFEERLAMIEAILMMERSIRSVARENNIPAATLRDWFRRYKAVGPEGLIPFKIRTFYSKEIKRKAVENVLLNGSSVLGTVKKFNISSSSVLRSWIKDYTGKKELKQTGRGLSTMSERKRTTFQERIEIVEFVIARDNDYQAAIQKYGISYQQIYTWVRKYNNKGLDGLQDLRGRRKEKETLTEIEQLRLENKQLKERAKFLEMEQDIVKKLQELNYKNSPFH